MACKYYRSNRIIAPIGLGVMSRLFVFVPGLIGSTSMMVIPSGALAIALAYVRFRRTQREREGLK